MNTMIWVMVMFLLVIIELLTINLTTVWFIFGTIAALILNNYKFNFVIQFVVFILVGLTLYLFVKPIAEKKIFDRRMKYFKNGIVGRYGKVTRTILPDRSGEVLIDGQRWIAVSQELIHVKSEIKVKKTNGLTLTVEKTKKAKKK